MADGSSKPISKIKVGDQVEAADPRTGKFEGAREVTKVWLNHDSDLVDVTVDDRRGHVATLHTAAGHLFWDATLGMWIDANDLMAGDPLAGPGVQGAHVDAVTPVTGPAERYNLTVADLHTYYVIAGDTTILVHNDGGDSSTDTGTDVDDNGVGTIFGTVRTGSRYIQTTTCLLMGICSVLGPLAMVYRSARMGSCSRTSN